MWIGSESKVDCVGETGSRVTILKMAARFTACVDEFTAKAKRQEHFTERIVAIVTLLLYTEDVC